MRCTKSSVPPSMYQATAHIPSSPKAVSASSSNSSPNEASIWTGSASRGVADALKRW